MDTDTAMDTAVVTVMDTAIQGITAILITDMLGALVTVRIIGQRIQFTQLRATVRPDESKLRRELADPVLSPTRRVLVL
jgi:hypothetical protein